MPTQARVAQAARYRKQPATPPHRRSTMLHEPIQQQLGRLGLRGAADMLARLPLNDAVIDALALLLEAECLHRDTLAQSRRLKLAKPGPPPHPAPVDPRHPRGLAKTARPPRAKVRQGAG